MLFPTSPNKWVHLKESTWPHGPITFAKSQWICAVPRKTLANTRFDSNLISDNTFSVLTLQSFTFFCLKTHQTKKKCLHACRTQKEACFHAPCVTQTLPNDEKGLRTRSSRQSIVPSFPLGTARRCHRGTIGGVTPVRLQEMAGLLVSPCDFLPHIRRDVWIGLIRATSFDENGTTCARLQPFKTNTHTHTPITPPITPMCHASLMTSNCGWKMFHNQIENKTRKRWRYYNTVISFPVAKCDISRRNYSWRPAALHHRTLPCNGATHTWTASFPSGRSTNGATQIHGSWFFWTSHKKTNKHLDMRTNGCIFFLPGANFYWLYEPPFCDRHLAARRPSVGSLCRFLHSVYGLFPMPLLCSSRRPRAYRRKVKVHMWVGFFFGVTTISVTKLG